MKITKAQLKQIIKEEISKVLSESYISDDELRRVHDLLNQGNIHAAKKLAAEDPDALSVIKQYEEELAAKEELAAINAPPTPEDELPEPY